MQKLILSYGVSVFSFLLILRVFIKILPKRILIQPKLLGITWPYQ